MQSRHDGFTLIEAMASVIVLSLGLLGLVQLQAHLWSTSRDLHSTDQAYLLAKTTLEKYAIAQMIAADIISDTSTPPPYSATLFSVDLSLSEQAHLTQARVRIEWEHQSGLRVLAMDTAIFTDSLASDNRLLLPVD